MTPSVAQWPKVKDQCRRSQKQTEPIFIFVLFGHIFKHRKSPKFDQLCLAKVLMILGRYWEVFHKTKP
jgi:hypothetical protein